MDDIVKSIFDLPPVDTKYVAGRWHRSRLNHRGFVMEARIFAKSLITPRNEGVRKFLIIGRARSGTTLLTRLLNDHRQVRCEGELLVNNVLNPVGMLDRTALKSDAMAWGAKVLSYQMIQVQRLTRPIDFLQRLEARGFRFVHIKRRTFDTTLSLLVAQKTSAYHSSDAPVRRGAAMHVDPQDFLRRIEWAERLLDFERICLRDLPSYEVDYERDLADVDRRPAAMDALFDWIGVPRLSVSSDLKKMLEKDPRRVIENYDEVAETLRAGGFGYLLPG